MSVTYTFRICHLRKCLASTSPVHILTLVIIIIYLFIRFPLWFKNTILISKTKANKNCYTVLEINEVLIFTYLKEFGFAEDHKGQINKSHTTNDDNSID